MSTPDISQLTEAQQTALQTYTAVTDQDPVSAIPILQRAEWNVQIAISRFFDGEPTTDLVEEARAAQAVPAPSTRHTTNLQYESLLAANGPRAQSHSPEDVVQRVDTSATNLPAYRPPFLLSIFFTPFSILYRILSSVLSPLSFLVPTFASRVFRNILNSNSQAIRRQLPPGDTAQRFIRDFEETYSPNPPLPFQESGFNLTLENCKKDGKFLLVVLLSPSHDDTNTWVRDTLLSSSFNQFLQSHKDEVVLWGGSVQDSEGYQVSTSLNCTKFPFAALVCQSSDGTSTARAGEMTVVARAAGPMTASELVAKFGTAITAQQAQLRAVRAQRAEQQAQRSLRQEQDSAYERSLAQDRERVRRRKEEEEVKAKAEKEAHEKAELEEARRKQQDQWRQWRSKQIHDEPSQNAKDAVRIQIRLSSGDRVIRKFHAEDQLEELYAFVECHDVLQEDGTYLATDPPEKYIHEYSFRLVSPMPRAVFDLEGGGTIGGRIGKGGNLIVEPILGEDDEDNQNEDED